MTRRVLTTVLAAILVLSAIGFAQGGRSEAFLEQTDEMLESAAERFGDDAPEEAVELYNNAMELQETAWELFEDDDIRAAMANSRNARNLLGRAIAIIDGRPGPGEGSEERILALIERNQNKIDEMTPIVEESGREELAEMLTNAQDLNDRAQEAYDDEEFDLAQRLAISASEVLGRLHRALTGGAPVSPDRISEFLEQTDEIIASVSERIGDDAPEEVLEAIEQAEILQSDAWEAFEEGEYRRALQLSQRARQLAQRTARRTHELDPEMVEARLNATDEFIERVAEDIEASDNEEAIAMLEEAIATQEEARAAFEDDNNEAALRTTMAAKRMAGRAATMVGSDIPAEDVLEALNVTDDYISEVTPVIEETENEDAISMLENATTVQANAWDEYESENYRPAIEKTTMARNIARRALTLSGASIGD
ncbi:MAG: hypothetical protein ACLFSQ_05910 [Candidatus Zixiibacteriota bacterium]